MQRQGSCHHAQPETADAERRQIAVPPYALAQCNRAQHDGDDQTNLMDPVRKEYAAKAGQRRDHDRTGQAMRHA